MLRNITIKARLIFVIGFLCLLSVVITATGLANLGATDASVKTLYEDRVVALGQLDTVLSLIQQNQITIMNALGADPKQLSAAADEVKERIGKASAVWKEFMATYLTPEEKVLAERFAASRSQLMEGALVPAVAAMRAGDIDKATLVVHGPMTKLFKPLQDDMNAGEQGRGFAVVASEVRSLAQRSAAVAEEIKTLIGDSVEKVDAGSKLVTEAGSTMGETVDSVKRVTDIMAASQKQSAGIEQVNQAISQMDQVTQQNAALVEEAAAAAASMQDQAGQLAQTVSTFKLDNNSLGMTGSSGARTSKAGALARAKLAVST